MLDLRTKIEEIIGIKADDLLDKVGYRIISSSKENGYERKTMMALQERGLN